MFLMLLLTVELRPFVHGDVLKPLNITKLEFNPGIYFEEVGRVGLYSNIWQVIVYYDLTDYNYELDKLSNYTENAYKLCQLIKRNHDETPMCEHITHQLHTITSVLQQNSLLLRPENNRYKRGLFNAVGTVSKTLFGTLDESDATEFNRQIDSLKGNQEHLLDLIKNQTLIIDTTVNIFNKTRRTIKKQFAHIDDKLERLQLLTNRVNSEITQLNITTELETLVSLTTLMMMRYQTVQNLLIDLVTNVQHGRPHPAIITPNQMKDALETIQKEIPNTLTLPITKKQNDLLQIYQISHVRTAIIHSNIIFHIKLPLPFKENYQLLKVYPLPTSHKDQLIYIKPSLEFLVIDYSREHYYTLNRFDLQNCQTTNLVDYLCRTIHPIFNVLSENNLCEVDLLKHSSKIPAQCEVQTIPKHDFWIQLAHPNKWLFSMREPITVDAVCENKLTPYKIQDTGILELAPGCYLRSKDLIIQAHNVKDLELNDHYLPSLNLTYTIPNYTDNSIIPSKVHVLKFHDNKDLQELKKAIELQKLSEKPKLSAHNIHHYSVSYTLVGIIIIFVLIGLATYKKLYKSNNAKPNKTSGESEEECGDTSYRLTVLG